MKKKNHKDTKEQEIIRGMTFASTSRETGPCLNPRVGGIDMAAVSFSSTFLFSTNKLALRFQNITQTSCQNMCMLMTEIWFGNQLKRDSYSGRSLGKNYLYED